MLNRFHLLKRLQEVVWYPEFPIYLINTKSWSKIEFEKSNFLHWIIVVWYSHIIFRGLPPKCPPFIGLYRGKDFRGKRQKSWFLSILNLFKNFFLECLVTLLNDSQWCTNGSMADGTLIRPLVPEIWAFFEKKWPQIIKFENFRFLCKSPQWLAMMY